MLLTALKLRIVVSIVLIEQTYNLHLTTLNIGASYKPHSDTSS